MQRIYVLGAGNVGSFFAHALRGNGGRTGHRPVTLLFHRPELLGTWKNSKQELVFSYPQHFETSKGFDVEFVESPGNVDQTEISHLIVATKATQTVEAVSSIARRLTSVSTIVFVQNGIGVIPKLNSALFPDPSRRPCYLAAVHTHGIKPQPNKPFHYLYAGSGSVTIGPTSASDELDSRSGLERYVLDSIVQATALHAKEVDASTLLSVQLEKLLVNSIINPLTALLNCNNGEIADGIADGSYRTFIEFLLEEALEVLPELTQRTSKSDLGFEKERLMKLVELVARNTASNICSMLQDVRAGRETEIDYINGWLVERGRETGKEMRNHKLLVKCVKEGRSLGLGQPRGSNARERTGD
ncbi:2-dehydropantoate 2-reductase [Calycina marina]|uniref:2-dehydropantoate 2-reductase n=1 Tax=Calycina marina TaxID=1763456 RepID=A0A9P7YZR6_9HELO|nr:2-dehydropantoate 2-reductase [Calycina marina]